MAKTLGRIISKEEANAEINEFLDIRQKTYLDIQDTVKNKGSNVVTYYSELENSFVFERALIDALFDKFSPEECNGVRVYYAAADKNETIDGQLRLKGSTTVVIVPCKIKYKNDLSGEIDVIDNVLKHGFGDGDAGEYPGGGNSSLTHRVDISHDPITGNGVRYFL